MPSNALAGLKVLDFGWVAAVPIMTLQLAQHGAEVIRVESSSKPDASRTTGPFVDEQATVSAAFMQLNSDKKSLGINLKHPDSREVIRELVKWADVITENFRPRTLEKLGLGYDELTEINPKIVVLRSSSAGQDGPWSTMAATGDLLQSLCGFTHLTGYPEDKPMPPWGAWTDITVPPLGVVSILAAVRQARITGQGQHLDMSQHELSLNFLADEFLSYQGTSREPQRQGNDDQNMAPHGVYPTSEGGWVALEIHDESQWVVLADLIGQQHWATDLDGLQKRKLAAEQIDEAIARWTRNRSKHEAMTTLQARGVPAGYVADSADVRNDPQLAQRNYFQEVIEQSVGPVMAPAAAYTLSETPAHAALASPGIGEHTWEVCSSILGIDEERIADLLVSGAIE